MDPKERQQKTKEIVSKFKGGDTLYQTNQMFNTCVQSLVRGADIYDVLGNVIMLCDDTQKALEQQIIQNNNIVSVSLNDLKSILENTKK